MAQLHLGKTATATAIPNGSYTNPAWSVDDSAIVSIESVNGNIAGLRANSLGNTALRFTFKPEGSGSTIEIIEILSVSNPPASDAAISVVENP